MNAFDFITSEFFLSIFYFVLTYIIVKSGKKALLINIVRYFVFVIIEIFVFKYIFMLSTLGIFPISFIIAGKNKSNNSSKGSHGGNNNSPIEYKNIDDNTLSEIGITDRSDFLNKAYNVFVDVQNAWMNFDYPRLRSLLSDELYNTYHSQLIALSKKKQKNVMSDFKKFSCDVIDCSKNGDTITVKVLLIVSFYDYIADEKDKVVRGTNNRKLTNTYVLTFVKNDNPETKDKKICPSCGSELGNTQSNVCPYCNNTIVFNEYDWILSKKEIKRQE